MIVLLLLFLVSINATAVIAFAVDKQRAIRGDWRISESTLLGLALIGGSPGTLWARRRFRHKTRKQPFSATLDFIVMLQIGVVVGLLIAFKS